MTSLLIKYICYENVPAFHALLISMVLLIDDTNNTLRLQQNGRQFANDIFIIVVVWTMIIVVWLKFQWYLFPGVLT